MRKGDIILVPFPFTSLQGNKTRPALVLYVGSKDITVSFISSKLHWKQDIDIVLAPNINNGLKVKSLVKISKIATLDKSLILGKLGAISLREIQSLNEKLIILFNLI